MNMIKPKKRDIKQSYTVPCKTSFRDAILALAERRRVNAADLARSVVLTIPEEVLKAYSDPGDPDAGDRETIIVKSGKAAGRPWRRKPRLQVRLGAGYAIETIRKALGVALDLEAGKTVVSLVVPGIPAVHDDDRHEALREEVNRLRATVSVLAFDPLRGGIQDRNDALYVLGFAPNQLPDPHTVKARFRMLATVHHPDGEFGDHERMSQLNEAAAYLRRHGG